MILNNFSSKNKFPQSANNGSKYNGYRSVIYVAQNFGHVQNKNLQRRTVSFPDQEKLMKEVDSD